MKRLKKFFAILPVVVIGVYASYKYVMWLVDGDISLTIKIMGGSTVIVVIITSVLYKMGYGER